MDNPNPHNLRSSIKLTQKANEQSTSFNFLQRDTRDNFTNPSAKHVIGQEPHPKEINEINNDDTLSNDRPNTPDNDNEYQSDFEEDNLYNMPRTPVNPTQSINKEKDKTHIEPPNQIQLETIMHEIGKLRQDIKQEVREEVRQVFEIYNTQIRKQIDNLHMAVDTLQIELEQLRNKVGLQEAKLYAESLKFDRPIKIKEQTCKRPIESDQVEPNHQEVIVKYVAEQGSKKPPMFNGKNHNPILFVNKLKQHVMREGKKGLVSTIDDLKEIIDEALIGSTSSWWQLNQKYVNSFEDFQLIFTDKYWSRDAQKQLKHRITYEKYRPGGPLSRSDYFLEKAALLRYLTINDLDEEEIVNILVEQFSQKIQDACSVQGIKTIHEMERLLNREDSEERNKTLRYQNKPDIHNLNNHRGLQNQNNPAEYRRNRQFIGNEPHRMDHVSRNIPRNEYRNWNRRDMQNSNEGNRVNNYQNRNYHPTYEQRAVHHMISNRNQNAAETAQGDVRSQSLNQNAPGFSQNRALHMDN